MAEKSAKKKQKKAADASVLGSLPATRPTRLGGDRRTTTPPPATATKPPAAKPRATAAKAAAKASTTKPKATKATKPKAAKAATTKPHASKPASSAPPAGWQVPGEADERRGSGPAEIVTTAVQAAGELAQIGLTVGGQILRRAAGRLPRP
jgi:hypothetical protein